MTWPVRREEGSPTVDATLRATTARLEAAGVVEPRANAEVLLAHVLGTTRTGLVIAARDVLAEEAAARLEALVARATVREPVHYLVGVREFWSLPFAVDARVLIPRPETELLVETALRVAPRARRVLDVGTGSGVVAAVLARELSGAEVWASDREERALAVARTNLERHAPGVRLVCADLLTAMRPRAFDLIVANLPYVSELELARLAPEVRDHEPRAALAAGGDGLAALRRLVDQAPAALAPGGWLVIEMGAGQAEAVRGLVASTAGFGTPSVVRDLGGVERVLAIGRRAEG